MDELKKIKEIKFPEVRAYLEDYFKMLKTKGEVKVQIKNSNSYNMLLESESLIKSAKVLYFESGAGSPEWKEFIKKSSMNER